MKNSNSAVLLIAVGDCGMLSVRARGVTVSHSAPQGPQEQSSVSFAGCAVSTLLKLNKCKNNSSSVGSLRKWQRGTLGCKFSIERHSRVFVQHTMCSQPGWLCRIALLFTPSAPGCSSDLQLIPELCVPCQAEPLHPSSLFHVDTFYLGRTLLFPFA